MARKRMIDPAIWQSEDFSRLSLLAKIVFIGLFSNADDYGKGRANPAYIKSMIFPYDDGIRIADIDKTLSEIASNMSVTLYDHNGSRYYRLDHWEMWQKVDKPTNSRFPDPDFSGNVSTPRGFAEDSPNAPRGFSEDSRLIRIEKNKNKNKNRIEDIMSEAEAPDRKPAVLSLPLNDGSLFDIYQENVDEWSELYPRVDIMQELRNMKGWLNANPDRRKTSRGIKRFINSWLVKEQDNGKYIGKQCASGYASGNIFLDMLEEEERKNGQN